MTADPRCQPDGANGCSATVGPVLEPTEVAQLLRSVAMLPPGCPTALDRDKAYAVLSQLEELQMQRRVGPHFTCCPYCRESFDTAHGLRPSPGTPNRPPRHPDPIGAADTLGGAVQAARSLAKSLAWGNAALRGPEAFSVDFGRTVLWPLLYLARATGRDMDDVRRLAHPELRGESILSVSAGLEALEASVEAERVRRQWERIVTTDAYAQRTAFAYAYGLVNHWQLTGPWAAEEGPIRPGE